MDEKKLQTLQDTNKKINDLKEFNIPVLLQVIKQYQEAGVDPLFIQQQQVQLQKVYARLHELEAKADRLRRALEQE